MMRYSKMRKDDGMQLLNSEVSIVADYFEYVKTEY